MAYPDFADELLACHYWFRSFAKESLLDNLDIPHLVARRISFQTRIFGLYTVYHHGWFTS